MTNHCLQCDAPKEDNELILCDECMNYFDMVQEATLNAQLEEIKRGMPE